MRLGKIKCAAKVGRLVGGFAALFILRRDSQTALPKFLCRSFFALSLMFCTVVIALQVTGSGSCAGRVCEALNFQPTTNLQKKCELTNLH